MLRVVILRYGCLVYCYFVANYIEYLRYQHSNMYSVSWWWWSGTKQGRLPNLCTIFVCSYCCRFRTNPTSSHWHSKFIWLIAVPCSRFPQWNENENLKRDAWLLFMYKASGSRNYVYRQLLTATFIITAFMWFLEPKYCVVFYIMYLYSYKATGTNKKWNAPHLPWLWNIQVRPAHS